MVHLHVQCMRLLQPSIINNSFLLIIPPIFPCHPCCLRLVPITSQRHIYLILLLGTLVCILLRDEYVHEYSVVQLMPSFVNISWCPIHHVHTTAFEEHGIRMMLVFCILSSNNMSFAFFLKFLTKIVLSYALHIYINYYNKIRLFSY